MQYLIDQNCCNRQRLRSSCALVDASNQSGLYTDRSSSDPRGRIWPGWTDGGVGLPTGEVLTPFDCGGAWARVRCIGADALTEPIAFCAMLAEKAAREPLEIMRRIVSCIA
jgi:hypothetical protein